LYKDGVSKYLAGKPAEYNMPFLFQSFSGQGRLETRPDFENVYILDKGNKRVIITDKKGNLIKTLVSGTFTKPEDFSVDEKNRVIYLLDDSQLLKFGF
jgi:DNA-binding beta-propeller fold protein YncE